ncbi:MAG TPA: hypothetical protein VLJ62_02525, partial [Burkholderiaceae bacterium]|nr:hypothetical protein [Burkholderiaceae bacterium]
LVDKRNNWSTAVGLCTALVGFTVLAADDFSIPATAANDRPAASADPMAAPVAQRYDKVSVVNGGASIDEAAAIKRIAPQYKLRVEISGRGGDYYVADRLQLMQRGEVIAEIPEAGPWLLIYVPPGHYTLVGEFADRKLQRDVNVAAAGTTVHWVLPSTVN